MLLMSSWLARPAFTAATVAGRFFIVRCAFPGLVTGKPFGFVHYAA